MRYGVDLTLFPARAMQTGEFPAFSTKSMLYRPFSEARARAEDCARTVGRALALVLAETARRVGDGARAAGTLTMQEGHARWLAAVLGPELELERIDERFLEDLVEHARSRGGRDGEPLALKTVQKRLSTLRRALVLAHRSGGPRVPQFPTFCSPPLRPQPLAIRSGRDYRRIFDALPRRRAEWFAVAFFSAQHAADVERMRWHEVKLEAPRWMLVRNTKNRRPELRVKMPRPLAEVLLARRARLAGLGRHVTPHDPLVDPWPSRSVQLARVCARLGLPLVNANTIRHASTSAMVRRLGITPAAQKWGGWQSARMMEVVYAHALPAQLGELADELETFVEDEGG